MPTFPGRIMTAARAAILAFQNSFGEDASADSYASTRANYYALLWSFYKSDAFEDWNLWGPYRQHHRLYRQTRLIYNPVRRLVDFYVSSVFPGMLSEDGSKLPEGVPLAMPLADDTPTPLKSAIAQLWQWSNWQANKAVFVRYGAAFGSVMLEVVDDTERRKVTSNIVRPEHVADLTLDAAGNVRAYALQYIVREPNGDRYTYRKEVERDTIRYYRDGNPYDYGTGAVVNPEYGFVPAVWVKHKDVGIDDGAPAIYGSLGKIRELNSLASHIHDRIHKDAEAPFVFWADEDIEPFTSGASNRKRGATADQAEPEADRESILMFSGPLSGRAEALKSGLDYPGLIAYVDKQIGELEEDRPELPAWSRLREMSQLTGPAASRVMGDVLTLVLEAQAQYDRGVIAHFQQSIAIAGQRVATGDWGELDRQREKFRGFDLDSYSGGLLDFVLMPRPLIPPTEAERIQAERARLALEAERLTVAAGGQSTIQARAAAGVGG